MRFIGFSTALLGAALAVGHAARATDYTVSATDTIFVGKSIADAINPLNYGDAAAHNSSFPITGNGPNTPTNFYNSYVGWDSTNTWVLPIFQSSGINGPSYSSPVTDPVDVAVTPGQTLHISATGGVCPSPDCASNPSIGPNGGTWGQQTNIDGFGIIAPFLDPNHIFALSGVFINSTVLTPFGYTPFFVGTGGDFVVPAGVTDLLLGLPDSSGGGLPSSYGDNTGSFTVSVTATAASSDLPEPMSMSLFGAGLAVLGIARRRRAA